MPGTNLARRTGQQALTTPISPTGFENASKILDTTSAVNGQTRLLPDSVCQSVVDWIDAEPVECGDKAAAIFVVRLIGCYPDYRAHNPQQHQRSLAEVFSAYRQSICEAVLNPVTGLPGRLAFIPKPAELREALEAERRRIDNIRANALTHIQERRRRIKEAEEEARYKPGTCEERKAQVDRLLAGFKQHDAASS